MDKHKDYCSKCKVTEVPLVKYCTNPTKGGGTISYYHCRPCNTERYQSWYHRNPEKARAIIYKNNKKHKEKIAARILLSESIRRGDTIKPSNCSLCKLVKKLEGHHEDYTKPLEVQWVCIGCHGDLHKKML